ncbi:MAG: glycosyltransferase family 2 protein [Desulfobacterales bacterium]|nr:glycosyltransferase family 2 protein [Desulfobacterales bacterium]
MPHISIIIPTYNRSFIVGKAIESVLQQTYDDYEIIVIDDGSTDHTYENLAPYRDRIRYEYKENGGIASARNRGLELARGEYIALLDSDDLWQPEKLQKQMACFAAHPEYGMVATRCITHTVDSHFNTIEMSKLRRSGKSGWIYKDLFFRNFIRTSSVVIKSECFRKVGRFDESLPRCEEIDMWLRLSKTYPVGFINEGLTIYTRRPKEIRVDNIEGRRYWLKVLEKNYDPDLIPKGAYKKRMARIYTHLAENLIGQGSKEEGEKALRQTLSLSPLDFKAWKNYLLLYLKR